jgi:hypothetical protein
LNIPDPPPELCFTLFLDINKLKTHLNIFPNGHEIQIKSSEVLTGDILYFKSGNAINAYQRTSAQTDISDSIPMNDKRSSATSLVVAIGHHTRSGGMMKIQDFDMLPDHDQSPSKPSWSAMPSF